MLISNKSAFELALREGLGFTQACIVSGNDLKALSEQLDGFPDYVEKLKRVILAVNTDLLAISSDYMGKNKYQMAWEVRKHIKAGQSLVLWGSLIDREGDGLTASEVVKAALMVAEPKDVATGLAMTYLEYVEYLELHPEIVEAITKMKAVMG